MVEYYIVVSSEEETMLRSLFGGALVALTTLFLFLGIANAHQQSCEEWPLNMHELDYCTDRKGLSVLSDYQYKKESKMNILSRLKTRMSALCG